jgi:hypothetical protein
MATALRLPPALQNSQQKHLAWHRKKSQNRYFGARNNFSRLEANMYTRPRASILASPPHSNSTSGRRRRRYDDDASRIITITKKNCQAVGRHATPADRRPLASTARLDEQCLTISTAKNAPFPPSRPPDGTHDGRPRQHARERKTGRGKAASPITLMSQVRLKWPRCCPGLLFQMKWRRREACETVRP